MRSYLIEFRSLRFYTVLASLTQSESPKHWGMFPPLRFSTSFAYYGLSMDLQKFGVDIYLIQVIFGAVDIPAKVVITVSMSVLGRRPSQCAALILSGVTILINLSVPFGE